MKEKITIFHAKKTNSKTPLSPYDDKTFVFQTYELTNNLEMYSVIVSNFILNIPLTKLDKPVRTFRRKVNLEQYYDEYISYFILDIDNVYSEQNKQKILDYFMQYKVIIGASKSYDGISNFRMKGLLFLDQIHIHDAKMALSKIHHDLRDLCSLDESVTRKATLNAPILKNSIFLNNENGVRYKFIKKESIDYINEIKNEYFGEGIQFNISDIENIEADTIEKLCLKVFQSMGFTAIKNNTNDSISFKHPSEKKTTGGYFWFSSSPYSMHHPNSVKTINIFDTIRKLPNAKKLMQMEISYDSEFLQFNTDTSIIQVNEKYLKVTDKIHQKICDFINVNGGLLSIRSPMGTGKSTIINHIIEECHEQDMRVLIITNRVSVATDFGKKYNINVYNQDKYNIGESLICQYDSLWKYNIKFFDIIIMDEFISLMMHSRSNLNNSSINIAKYFACFNKKLVIADAFLTGYENFLLSTKGDNIHLIDNIYRDPTTLFSYDDFNYFVQSILVHTEKHKVTISATSLSFIMSMQMLLKKRGLNVITLTAETPDSTKKLIYELFEKDEHDKWDVLIYSPTLTVGVSNMNTINYHFHYDSSMSTDVISSIQMIKRTRKAKEIHMCINEKINYVKTTYNSIRDEYIGNMGKNIEQNYMFDVDEYGEGRLSEIGKKAIKIDTFKNILEFDHKRAMVWFLKYHFMKEPRIIDSTFVGDVLHKYKTLIRDNKHTALSDNINQFLSLNNIQKTALLMDNDSDKTLRILAEIENRIKDGTDTKIKSRILECALNDKSFVEKSKYYRAAFNYTKMIWDITDIQNLVSQSVISGKNDDIHFYNSLLSYGQKEIYDAYLPKDVNKDKRLKYILDKCGYSITKQNNPNTIGHRGYIINPLIKEYYGYIC